MVSALAADRSHDQVSECPQKRFDRTGGCAKVDGGARLRGSVGLVVCAVWVCSVRSIEPVGACQFFHSSLVARDESG